MNRRQLRALASVDKAITFLDDPEVNVGRIASIRTELVASRKRVAALVVTQDGALQIRGADGIEMRKLRRALRHKHLLPISQRGKLLLKGLPGIDDSLRVPHATARDDELLAAAKRIAGAVRPHAKAFTKAQFPRGFIKDLERAAAALEKTTSRTETVTNRATRATADLRDALAHSRQLLAAADTLMRAQFYGDRAKLALWQRAKRIPAEQGRPRASRRATSPTGSSSNPTGPASS